MKKSQYSLNDTEKNTKKNQQTAGASAQASSEWGEMVDVGPARQGVRATAESGRFQGGVVGVVGVDPLDQRVINKRMSVLGRGGERGRVMTKDGSTSGTGLDWKSSPSCGIQRVGQVRSKRRPSRDRRNSSLSF